MALEINEMFVEIICESAVGDVPHLDGAVLGRAGDNVVVERVPFDVQHLSAVTADL